MCVDSYVLRHQRFAQVRQKSFPLSKDRTNDRPEVKLVHILLSRSFDIYQKDVSCRRTVENVNMKVVVQITVSLCFANLLKV